MIHWTETLHLFARRALRRRRGPDRFGRVGPGSAVLGGQAHLPRVDDRVNRFGLEPLMGVTELADYLGVPAQRIYDWRLAGVGPRGYRLGRELKFPVSEISRWLAARDERNDGAASSNFGAAR